MNDGSSLPAELDACHRLIAQLSLERDQLSSERDELSSRLAQQARSLDSREAFVQEQSRTVIDLEASHQQLCQENVELKLTVKKLMEQLYGRRRERFVADPQQILLDFGDDAAAAAEALAEAVLEAERTIEEVAVKRRPHAASRPRPAESYPHLCRATGS